MHGRAGGLCSSEQGGIPSGRSFYLSNCELYCTLSSLNIYNVNIYWYTHLRPSGLWSYIMMRKVLLIAVLVLSCFAVHSQESLFESNEENLFNLFNLDDEKVEVIKKLYESEGLLNGWFKGCMQDFVKCAKEYDKAKVKNEKMKAKLEDYSVKVLMFAVLCTLIFPSFDDSELSQYTEAFGLNEALDNLSGETTSYLDRLGNQIMDSVGLAGNPPNKKLVSQYVNITVDSIREYLNSKKKEDGRK